MARLGIKTLFLLALAMMFMVFTITHKKANDKDDNEVHVDLKIKTCMNDSEECGSIHSDGDDDVEDVSLVKPKALRFLLVGETGVGKTTTTNHLTGTTNKVSDSAVGVTLDFQSGFRSNVEIIDTVGLSEGDAGSVHPAVAFAKLVKFAKENGEGFNGIFIVTATPRVTSSMQDNYRLFVEKVTQGKVPSFLFINKQELEDDFRNQYGKNKRLYEKAGLDFKNGFAGGWKTEDAREWTEQRFDACIAEAPKEKVPLYTKSTWSTFIKRLWRDLCSFLATLFDIDYEDDLDDTAEGVFRKLGVPKRLARELASKLQHLNDRDIQDLADKLKSQKQG